MGSKGDSYDNAAAEALNSLYKRELIDRRKDWQGVDDVMLATMDWVQWYNEDRIHSYSADMPPRKYEEIYYQALQTGKLTSSSQTYRGLQTRRGEPIIWAPSVRPSRKSR